MIIRSATRREAIPACDNTFCSAHPFRLRHRCPHRRSVLGTADRPRAWRNVARCPGFRSGRRSRRRRAAAARCRAGRSATTVPSRSRNSSVVANVVAPVSSSVPGLGDQPARHQRADHRVDVDAAHRADPRPGHRLAVGHHRQCLQRRPGQLRPRRRPAAAARHTARTGTGCTSASRRRPRAGRSRCRGR